MSGVCGVVDFSRPADAFLLATMLESIAHRGPDATSSFVEGAAALGQVHLESFVPAGSPVRPAFADTDTPVAALDGPVINRDAFRGAAGGSENPDVAAVLAAYTAHGDACLSHLKGPFTLALWDRQQQRLLLSRDSIGEKSLYYYVDPASRLLVFGSEIKALLAHPAVKPALDHDSLSMHLAFGYLPGRGTLFRGVSKLLPGEYLTFDADEGVRTAQYWAFPIPSEPLEDDEATVIARLKDLFLGALERYLGGAREVGVFLSGGVDSSLLVAGLHELGIRTSTFTVGFEVESKNPQANADLYFARAVAERFATDHHELVVEEKPDLERDLPAVLRYFDDLVMTPNTFTKVQMARDLRERGLKSAFCGLGSGGEIWDAKRRARIERKIRGTTSDEQRYFNVNARLFNIAQQEQVLRRPPPGGYDGLLATLRDLLPEVDEPDPLRRVRLKDPRATRPEKSIKGWEKACSMAGVELRSPLYDPHLVEFTRRIPSSFNGEPTNRKTLFKKAFASTLPESTLNRKVMGYPTYYFTGGELAALQERLFSRAALDADDIFSYDGVQAVLESDRSSELKTAGKHSWALTQFALWHEIQIKRNPAYL